MNEFQQMVSLLSLTMGVAWASGINLYAAVLVLGITGATGNIDLPPGLEMLQDPLVIAAAGVMYCIEFFADKTPGVDTGWDAIHTFIRIPAGAMLAASAVGDVTPALQVAAGLLGGTLSAATHATKAGSRVIINTSPEPVSNWLASLSEDGLVILGLWTAMNHPLLFIALLILFIGLMIWLLPRLWRAIRALLRKLAGWLGFRKPSDATDTSADHAPAANPTTAEQLAQLAQLHRSGALTQEEFERAKQRLLA
jgi:hypothetical protein